jgi:hypothetical protein
MSTASHRVDEPREDRRRRDGEDQRRPADEDRRRPANRPRASETDEGDFGAEHTKPTYVDEVPDGPEHTPDPDSPAGLAGADPDET